jgi:hypothetical protein
VAETILRELERGQAAHSAIVKAIVALNFDEPAHALKILLEALSDYNFPETHIQFKKENSYVRSTEAA